jgi:hypothetical protein
MDNKMADIRSSRTGLPALALLLAFGVLAGCGTDVKWLLTEQGQLTPKADRLTTAAEALGTGIEKPVYDAEDSELEACRFLTEATAEAMQQKEDPTIGQQMVTDLSVAIVQLVPIERVERCADSIDAYRQAIAELDRKLVNLGVVTGTPTTASGSRQ